ncbi:MAG: lysophospholipid acyltransferase family protein [Planctomycetota bacterium]
MSAREGLLRRWGRRTVSFTLLGLGWSLGVLSLALLPLLVLCDLARGTRLAWARGHLAVLVFLSCEVLGLLVASGLWLLRPLLSRARWLALNHALQRRWCRALFGALRRLFGVRLRVEGAEVLRAPGPLVVLSRHTSLLDTLLPLLVLEGRPLRYVLKQELLWDPCLDVVGQRIPNAFVRRGGDDTAGELAKLAELAQGLGSGEAVVIFPEGTRFTPAKRARVLEALARRADPAALARAAALERVLPPRAGGARELLRAAPEACALLLAHTGLERAGTLASLWSGALIGQEVRVRLTRTPAAAIPREPAALEGWLWATCQELDAWLASAQVPEPEVSEARVPEAQVPGTSSTLP